MIHTFTFYCMDCGKIRYQLKLDEGNPDHQARLNSIYSQIDRLHADEIFGSRLCKACEEWENERERDRRPNWEIEYQGGGPDYQDED